jgi:hypothetical protein
MSYHIESIELYVRDTKPNRMAFSLGKTIGTKEADLRSTSPLAHVRLVLKNSAGDTTFGCAADRLSVRWLDKRPGRDRDLKRRELVRLIETAREIVLDKPEFDSPFAKWQSFHPVVMQAGRKQGQEDLTSSFASALFERAIIDAVCRLEGLPVFDMLVKDQLGFRPAEVHPEIGKLKFPATLPFQPARSIYVRHTVGGSDPLTSEDLPDDKRVNDGLPETLEEYIKADGLRHFKVKISGDLQADLQRLNQIWRVILQAEQPVITLDANEAYTDLGKFAEFVETLERDNIGLFQHIEYIEQPLPRGLTLDPKSTKTIQRIAERKAVIIDEADGTLNSFKRAHAIGYQGTSHKNCKGFFKSLLNHALVVHYGLNGEETFLSGEDLQNLPVVPLHQDFATCVILGITHCERNGHHYNFGLSMLSEKDKANAVKHHPDMYVRRGKEWFLNVQDGAVSIASLQRPGFGVTDEPDWASMTDMRKWVDRRHPAE